MKNVETLKVNFIPSKNKISWEKNYSIYNAPYTHELPLK